MVTARLALRQDNLPTISGVGPGEEGRIWFQVCCCRDLAVAAMWDSHNNWSHTRFFATWAGVTMVFTIETISSVLLSLIFDGEQIEIQMAIGVSEDRRKSKYMCIYIPISIYSRSQFSLRFIIYNIYLTKLEWTYCYIKRFLFCFFFG